MATATTCSKDIQIHMQMGCANSRSKHQATTETKDPAETLKEIEKEIWEEEQQIAPAPALTHTISKLEKITSDIEKISVHITQSQESSLPSILSKPNVNDERDIEEVDNSIKRIITDLNMTKNAKAATEHEEFLANLNRRALRCRNILWLNRKKQHLEDEASKLSDRVQHLQKLYEHQDVLLKELLGSSYSSRTEMQLDKMRNYRDTLYSKQLAWKDAISLAESAAVFAQAGYDSWKSLNDTMNEESRFNLAKEARNVIQDSALSIQAAQSMLNTVQFPYCSSREIYAVLQVIEYLFTDMQIPERINHAREVYKSFQKRANALSDWLGDVMNNSIQKDVEEVDVRIRELIIELNNEKQELLSRRAINLEKE